MSEDTISIRIKLKDAAAFAGDTRIAAIEVDELGNAAERANRKSKKASGGMNELKKSAKGLQGLFKPALIVAGIGLLTQMFTTASAGAVGLLGALAPVSGLILALPAAFMLAAQGAGVLKLGLAGVGGALGGLNGQINPKKFAALSKPGQEFVLTLNSMKGPIRELQRRVQDGLLPGLTKGLKAATPALDALIGPLAQAGSVVGRIGARLGGLVGSRGFAKDLGDQARFNNVQLGRLGVAGVHIVDVFRQLMVAARPLVSWIVRLAGGWAASADKAATAGRANGKLAGMFKTIQHTVGSVLSILGNVGHTIFNIGNLGRKHLGESLLGSLVKGSAALRKWTESGPGVQKITRFFEQAKPVVYAFAELIKTAVRELFKLGTGGSGGLTSFFTQLRTEVLPEMTTLSKNLIGLFGFISRSIPGGSWLLTIGYVLSKLNGGGLIVMAAKGLGKRFGITMATEAAAGAGAETGLFALAGTALGTAFGVALAAAAVALAVAAAIKIGHILRPAEHTEDINGATGLPMSKGETQTFLSGQAQKVAEARQHASPRVKAMEHHLDETLHHRALLREKQSKGAMQLVERQYNHPAHRAIEHMPGLRPLVSPLPGDLGPSLSAPSVAKVTHSSAGHGWGAPPIHIQLHSQLKMTDGKPIAESTSEVVAVHKALQ